MRAMLSQSIKALRLNIPSHKIVYKRERDVISKNELKGLFHFRNNLSFSLQDNFLS